jgi:hypothetical protein
MPPFLLLVSPFIHRASPCATICHPFGAIFKTGYLFALCILCFPKTVWRMHFRLQAPTGWHKIAMGVAHRKRKSQRVPLIKTLVLCRGNF